MCGRFTLHTVREALARRFEISLGGFDLAPRYNIAPTQRVLTVVCTEAGERHAEWMRWGLIAPWEPEPHTKLSTINARIETVATSRLYASPLQKRRCLVLADGYYEWQPVATEAAPAPAGAGQTRAGGARKAKQPYWIHRVDREPFAFAGIYSIWRPRNAPEAEPVWSCSIVTAPAFASLASIHARMPVILRPELESRWIDHAPGAASELLALLEPDLESNLAHYPVRTLVNSPRRDGPELILDAPQAGF